VRPRGFQLRRQAKSANGETFATAFGLSNPGSTAEHEVFIPAVWYRQQSECCPNWNYNDKHQKPGKPKTGSLNQWFGVDRSRDNWVRTSRSTLPLVAARDPATQETLSLLQTRGPGTLEGMAAHASLGTTGRSVDIVFPGCEAGKKAPWQARPVRKWAMASSCDFAVTLSAGTTATYAKMVRAEWRAGFAAWNPVIRPVAPDRLAADVVAYLSKYLRYYTQKDNKRPAPPPLEKERPADGILGWPWSVNLETGAIWAVTFSAGGTSPQPTCAAMLVRWGARNGDAAMVARAGSVLDFWAAEGMTAEGAILAWGDYPKTSGRKPTWRQGEVHSATRYHTDAGEAFLAAHKAAPRASWLAAATKLGDFLVRIQCPADGSIPRGWDMDWTTMRASPSTVTAADVENSTKNLASDTCNTVVPVKFLLDLHRATGQKRFLDAALRAAEFSYANDVLRDVYQGGTAEDLVYDAVATQRALSSFLAVRRHYEDARDGANEARFLAAAEHAALYCETWTICADYTIQADPYKGTLDPVADPVLFPYSKNPFPGCGTVGLQTSGCGVTYQGIGGIRSYADFYKLYRITRDPHYLHMSNLLLHNASRFSDWDGSIGYANRATCAEGIGGVDFVAKMGSRNNSLFWITRAQLEPMLDMLDAFGAVAPPGLAPKA